MKMLNGICKVWEQSTSLPNTGGGYVAMALILRKKNFSRIERELFVETMTDLHKNYFAG